MGLNIEQLMQQGISAHQAGKLQEAQSCYKKVLQTQSTHPHANHNLGILSVYLKDSENALNLFKKAILSNPNIEQFWMSFISTLIKERQFENAKQALKKAKKKGLSKDKINILNQQMILEIKLEKPSQTDINKLIKFHQDGLHKDAEKLADCLTKQFTNDPLCWKLYGEILKINRKLTEALIATEKAVHLNPKDAEAFNNLAGIYLELNKFKEAEKNFKQAITLKPNFVHAHNNLGSMMKKLDRLEEAEISYKNCIVLQPDNAEAYNNLGVLQHIQGNIESALKSLERANTIDANLATNKLCLAMIKAQKNRDNNTLTTSKLISNPLISNRPVEKELIDTLYEINSSEFKEQKDCRFGNGRCSNYELFKDKRTIIQKVANDLINIMMNAVRSEIYIYDSFFNIIGAGGGLKPHDHLMNLDKDKHLNFAKQKYSVGYYLSVGDQSSSEPGVLKFYDPNKDILPKNGNIVIFPSERKHSIVYNGQKDRVMIGVNFYSL